MRCHAGHAVKTVRLVRSGTGDRDLSLLQALLQHVHHVFVIRQQLQQPDIQLFMEREHL